jgi:MoaA/NifB/PqqE/SkfB family radical SAM enzyme
MHNRSSLFRRALQIAWRQPELIPTLMRMEYRQRWGVPRDQRRRFGWSAPPTSLSLYLTYRCNLRCTMCMQFRGNQKIPSSRTWYDRQQELPLETWISLLDQVSSFRPWIHLLGGEPLLYPRFTELVWEARKRRLNVHVQTNGTLLAGVADSLVQAGMTVVCISLDGPPEVHDAIRGVPGTFRKLEEGVQALLAARAKRRRPTPVLSVNCTISQDNIERLPEMVPLALRLGVETMQIQHPQFNSPAKEALHNKVLTPERVEKLGLDMAFPSICEGEYYQSTINAADVAVLQKSLVQIRRLAAGKLIVNFLPNLPLELLPAYYLDLDYPFAQSCDYLWKNMKIFADGTHSPCLNFQAGNIAADSFADMWNGPRMQKLRLLFQKQLLPGCVRCCRRYYSQGDRTPLNAPSRLLER